MSQLSMMDSLLGRAPEPEPEPKPEPEPPEPKPAPAPAPKPAQPEPQPEPELTPSQITEARRAAFNVDSTPPMIVYMVVDHLLRGWRPAQWGLGEGLRILDLCAGAGAWSMVLRLLLPRAEITAVEVRPECEKFLRLWADHVIIGDAEEVLPTLGTFDLIIGNPPFSMRDEEPPRERVERRVYKPNPDARPRPPTRAAAEAGTGIPKSRQKAFEVLVCEGRRHLRTYSSKLALYLPSCWCQRGHDPAVLIENCPPQRQYNIPLPVHHRGVKPKRKKGDPKPPPKPKGEKSEKGKGADTRPYIIYAWGHPDAAHAVGWHTMQLPILQSEDLRWTHLPGSTVYEIDRCSCDDPVIEYGLMCRSRHCTGSRINPAKDPGAVLESLEEQRYEAEVVMHWGEDRWGGRQLERVVDETVEQYAYACQLDGARRRQRTPHKSIADRLVGDGEWSSYDEVAIDVGRARPRMYYIAGTMVAS